MKKLSKKQMEFIEKKANEEIEKRKKNNKTNVKRVNGRRKRIPKLPIETIVAPSHFSILENRDKTLSFFEDIYIKMQSACKLSNIIFDLSKVERITTDALMYLLAIIKNAKIVERKELTCSGNLPYNDEAKKIVLDSGFLHYVKSRDVVINNDKVCFKIMEGNSSNEITAQKICDFVQEGQEKTKRETKGLYAMIMEMITNATEHAYNKEREPMHKKWYIFAEKKDIQVKITFLDTGLGIPKTVKKKYIEKAAENLKLMNDSQYISSALRGEQRSETKERHRGEGLPCIVNNVDGTYVEEVVIISNKGSCRVLAEKKIIEDKMSEGLMGTLFMWTVNK